MLCYYEVRAGSGLICKAEMFASNFSALENYFNILPRKMGEDYPMMWYHIPVDKNLKNILL